MLAKTDEIQYANDQCNQWQEIADYMSLLIKGGGKLVYDEDNAIEIPKDETPAYFEWTLWRAALAIDHMVNKPHEVRGFRLDSDFLPVTAAGGGKGDLYCEFEDFMILTEVTMSTSSRQEAMEGEPVRRHVSVNSDLINGYIKNEFEKRLAEKNSVLDEIINGNLIDIQNRYRNKKTEITKIEEMYNELKVELDYEQTSVTV